MSPTECKIDKNESTLPIVYMLVGDMQNKMEVKHLYTTATNLCILFLGIMYTKLQELDV